MIRKFSAILFFYFLALLKASIIHIHQQSNGSSIGQILIESPIQHLLLNSTVINNGQRSFGVFNSYFKDLKSSNGARYSGNISIDENKAETSIQTIKNNLQINSTLISGYDHEVVGKLYFSDIDQGFKGNIQGNNDYISSFIQYNIQKTPISFYLESSLGKQIGTQQELGAKFEGETLQAQVSINTNSNLLGLVAVNLTNDISVEASSQLNNFGFVEQKLTGRFKRQSLGLDCEVSVNENLKPIIETSWDIASYGVKLNFTNKDQNQYQVGIGIERPSYQVLASLNSQGEGALESITNLTDFNNLQLKSEVKFHSNGTNVQLGGVYDDDQTGLSGKFSIGNLQSNQLSFGFSKLHSPYQINATLEIPQNQQQENSQITGNIGMGFIDNQNLITAKIGDNGFSVEGEHITSSGLGINASVQGNLKGGSAQVGIVYRHPIGAKVRLWLDSLEGLQADWTYDTKY